ncbi:hypothetical protein CU097_013649 [Rhizopus azygosporus]|uniref:ER membrane protein complex subunit 7 beta-sandwich domain-containing protein n=1 Tax=Rhizopus azygosporus TaxID=86630 RepID=A0A367JZ46_RHIAZ|nr:hypothetical protein CU097_013649 [Rhizopus azygosporus]
MKFTSLLVFTLSSANAEKEPTVLQFLPVPHIFPPMYRIRAELLSSRTSHEIVLRTDSPDLFAYYSQRTRGVVNYEKLPNGQYNVVINDNDAKGGDEPFRIDLIRSGEEFHYEGTSVTYKWIDDVKGYGNVRAIDDDGLRYGHPRFYRN